MFVRLISKRVLTLPLVLLVVGISACREDVSGDSTSTSETTVSTTTTQPQASDLDSAKALWEADGPDSYELTYEKRCFCPQTGPITVTVEDGEIADVSAPEADDEAEVAEDALTVEDLFDKAADAEEKADASEIAYDEEYGYPTLIDVDHSFDAYDDEYTYEVTRFENLD
ncbi:MAG: hypothetical protein JJLCMIEE_01665 [Acidimicrobiales bacterium]|nr:MAG: hypothetical protein EDR02_05175 [Actinomycetota bacterium]MBV6508600.1 hypothetical protein [Acidimicrobiales bacterium]RIK08057.1 MAG: hypothetical protein DCC48_01295 [Acidobacteriota bacterium]